MPDDLLSASVVTMSHDFVRPLKSASRRLVRRATFDGPRRERIERSVRESSCLIVRGRTGNQQAKDQPLELENTGGSTKASTNSACETVFATSVT